jgi:hypothetical protein
MTLEKINTWHQRARPEPTQANFGVQLGCHVEEILEMFEVMRFENEAAQAYAVNMEFYQELKGLADLLKSGGINAIVTDRKEFLDALADQVVTAVGVGHCANLNIVEACKRVDDSNWSKYDDQGRPIFKDTGKIAKGPNYIKPDLEGLY